MRQPQGHVVLLYFVFRYSLHYFSSRGKEPLVRPSYFLRFMVSGVSPSGFLSLAHLLLYDFRQATFPFQALETPLVKVE